MILTVKKSKKTKKRFVVSRSCYSFQEDRFLFFFIFCFFSTEEREETVVVQKTGDSRFSGEAFRCLSAAATARFRQRKLENITGDRTDDTTNAGKSPSAVVSVATSASPVAVPNVTRRIYYARENYAAVVIQTSFRGYLVSYKQLARINTNAFTLLYFTY